MFEVHNGQKFANVSVQLLIVSCWPIHNILDKKATAYFIRSLCLFSLMTRGWVFCFLVYSLLTNIVFKFRDNVYKSRKKSAELMLLLVHSLTAPSVLVIKICQVFVCFTCFTFAFVSYISLQCVQNNVTQNNAACFFPNWYVISGSNIHNYLINMSFLHLVIQSIGLISISIVYTLYLRRFKSVLPFHIICWINSWEGGSGIILAGN